MHPEIGFRDCRWALPCLVVLPLGFGCKDVDQSDAAALDTATTSSQVEDTSSAPDTGTEPLDAPGDSESLVGAFVLQLVAPGGEGEGYTSFLGQVFDGPTPSPWAFEEVAVAGECRLLRPFAPFCEEPCGAAVCVEDDQCMDYPRAVSVGTVTLEGVRTSGGDNGMSVEPVAESYQWAGDPLPYPAFQEGAAVSLTASGDGRGTSFSLAAAGIAPLLLETQSVELSAETDVVLRWTAAAESNASTVRVELDVSHHGGTRGLIECHGEDDGELVLSGSLVAQLLELGVAGFPSITVTRQAVGSAVISLGRVDLVLRSQAERDVTIPGLVSCTSDEDCDDGQTCQTDMTCG